VSAPRARKRLRAGGAYRALLGGPSTSPLDGYVRRLCKYHIMNSPKNRRHGLPLKGARRVLESLTPAEAMALRRRFGLDMPPNSVEDDETLRSLARQLATLKKRNRR
jgi:hypothetical protein